MKPSVPPAADEQGHQVQQLSDLSRMEKEGRQSKLARTTVPRAGISDTVEK